MQISLRVNATVAWMLVVLNLFLLGYFAILYYQGQNISEETKGAQGGLTFAIWMMMVSDIFMIKMKDRWFWTICMTVLLPVAAPVYLWRRQKIFKKRIN